MLTQAGAEELDLRAKLPGALVAEDEELAYVGVRRPLLEWALRRAALAQQGIVVRVRVFVSPGSRARTAALSPVYTDDGDVTADLVVDAMGRSSPAPAWLTHRGRGRQKSIGRSVASSYYCRYYRVLPGQTLPDGPWIPTPRAMLPYAAFSSFPGDNRTFGTVLAIPPEDRDLKVLRHEPAFEAAISTMPALHAWTSRSEPITDVLPMGSLQNTFRRYARDGSPRSQRLCPGG